MDSGGGMLGVDSRTCSGVRLRCGGGWEAERERTQALYGEEEQPAESVQEDTGLCRLPRNRRLSGNG